jgi:hypothetical protein
MHSLAALAVLTGLVALPTVAAPGPEIGKPAPAFTLVDAQGKTHSLSDYKGKVVVIEWVNITCPNAQAVYESGLVPKLQKKYAAKDVVWLSMIITEKQQDEYGANLISPERAQSMAADLVEKYGASPAATLIDLGGTVSAKYDTRTSMHLFVVDKNGTLAYDGALDDQRGEEGENYVASAIDAITAGKPVATTQTMPYGCHPVGDNLVGGSSSSSGSGSESSAAEEGQ